MHQVCHWPAIKAPPEHARRKCLSDEYVEQTSQLIVAL
jgi:hypothetical protein